MALVHEFFPIAPKAPSEALLQYYRSHPEAAARCHWPEGTLRAEADRLDGRLIRFYDSHRRTGLEIHDDFIEGRCAVFAGVPALFNGFLPRFGLNYYAITLFQREHLPALRTAIAEQPELEPLMGLCLEAEGLGMDIVHFGI